MDSKQKGWLIMENRIPKRFFIVTFLWSWFFIGILIFIGHTSSRDLVLSGSLIQLLIGVMGACGPALGAIVSIYTIDGKKALNPFFKQFLSLKFGLKTWSIIILSFGIINFTSWIIPELFGEERIPSFGLPPVWRTAG